MATLVFLVSQKGLNPINFGIGKSKSVLELLTVFEKIFKQRITKKIYSQRRMVDLSIYNAKVDKSANLLVRHAKRNLFEVCQNVLASQVYLKTLVSPQK